MAGGRQLPFIQFLARKSADQCTICETLALKADVEVDATRRRAETECPTAFGRNVDRLRKECGWSFDDLANKTGLEKKLILGHVNEGRGAQPRTKKTYADAFAKELKRTVTVTELEG